MPTIQKRLQDLNIHLPAAPKPVAAYVPWVRTSSGIVVISGQIPFRDGEVPKEYKGAVPSKVSLELAQRAARQCVLNGLAVLSDAVHGDLDRVHRIVRLGVFICCDPGFTDQPKVANGASELLVEIFSDKGRHARAAVGSIALPLGVCVEVEMMAEVED